MMLMMRVITKAMNKDVMTVGTVIVTDTVSMILTTIIIITKHDIARATRMDIMTAIQVATQFTRKKKMRTIKKISLWDF